MGYPVKSAPENCVYPTIRGERTCVDCYYDHVINNQWNGPQPCWGAQCIVLDVDKLSDYERQMMNL